MDSDPTRWSLEAPHCVLLIILNNKDKGLNINSQPFVCFDIETTGLNPLVDSVIEIGAVKFSVDQGEINRFESFIAFNGEIPEKVIKIHGITSDMLEGAPELSDVLIDFIRFIGDCPLVAHNASFDCSFIGYQLGKLGFTYPSNSVYDSLIISRKVFSHLQSHSLSSLKKTFEINSNQSHRALDDALATSEIFNLLTERWSKKRNRPLDNLKKEFPPIHFSDFSLETFNSHVEQVDQINEAMGLKRKVLITYLDKQNKKSEREILPTGIVLNNGYLYLDGYCYLRKEDRRFRLDRIQNIRIQPEELVKKYY